MPTRILQQPDDPDCFGRCHTSATGRADIRPNGPDRWKPDILLRSHVPSEIVGTAFLWAIFALAAVIAYSKRNEPPAPTNIAPLVCLTLALQAVHCAEEFVTGFHITAPVLLGLAPWSPGFFVSLNLVWIALWSIALGAVSRGVSIWPVMTALWFLSLAAVANGFVHPLLSLLTADYFPGTITAIPLGFSGFVLARRMGSGRRR